MNISFTYQERIQDRAINSVSIELNMIIASRYRGRETNGKSGSRFSHTPGLSNCHDVTPWVQWISISAQSRVFQGGVGEDVVKGVQSTFHKLGSELCRSHDDPTGILTENLPFYRFLIEEAIQLYLIKYPYSTVTIFCGCFDKRIASSQGT